MGMLLLAVTGGFIGGIISAWLARPKRNDHENYRHLRGGCLMALLSCNPIDDHNKIIAIMRRWTPDQIEAAYHWAINTSPRYLAIPGNDNINPGPMPEYVKPTQKV